MAWTTPRTWVTSEVVSASIMNTHVRDNFNETGPAVATATQGFIFADGANSLAERSAATNEVAASESTTSTSYTDLSTSGPAATVFTGTRALVLIGARLNNNTGGEFNWMSIAVSGSTTLSPQDKWALMHESDSNDHAMMASRHYVFTGITGGSNTFTAKYKVSGGTGSFDHRQLSVLPA